MFCFHFVAGNRLSRNLLYGSFASLAMFIGSAFSPAFFARELGNARPFWCPLFCVVGLPAVLRSYLPGWVYHFRCRLPGIPSIHSTTQTTACLFSAGGVFRTRILHDRSLLPKFCGLSALRMMWCDAKTRRAAPHYLPRQKALINHRNSLEYTQEHIPWLLKCLHYNTKLLCGQKIALQREESLCCHGNDRCFKDSSKTQHSTPFSPPNKRFPVILGKMNQFMKSNLPPLGKKWKVGIFELAHGLNLVTGFPLRGDEVYH